MITPRQTISDALTNAIRQQYACIISEHSVSDCRFHAYARGTPDEDEVFHPKLLETGMQVSLIEAAVSMFVDDNITGVRLEFRDDICVPGVSDQSSTLGAVWKRNCVSYPHSHVPHSVRRVGSTQIREIGAKAHFEIDNLETRVAGRSQGSCGKLRR